MLATWSLLLQGCYTSLPLQQAPPPVAVRLQLVLNDAGRAALSDRLGTAVDKAEGQIVSEDGSSYTMEVFRVYQLNGNSAAWNGERVRVAKEHTIGYQLRKLDKVRTWSIAAGLTLVAVAILTRSLNGSGSDTPTQSGPPQPSR